MVSFKMVTQIIVAITALEGIAAMDFVALAQDSAPAEAVQQSPREQQLREQLKGILQELEDLQKSHESTLPPAERPTTVTEKIGAGASGGCGSNSRI